MNNSIAVCGGGYGSVRISILVWVCDHGASVYIGASVAGVCVYLYVCVHLSMCGCLFPSPWQLIQLGHHGPLKQGREGLNV